MNEIPKNSPAIPQQPAKIEQVKTEDVQDVMPHTAEEQTKEITEIPENPAARSTVKVDNLENDIKMFVQNPEVAAKALEIAELAEKRYADAGLENPELKALAVGKAFREEFAK